MPASDVHRRVGRPRSVDTFLSDVLKAADLRESSRLARFLDGESDEGPEVTFMHDDFDCLWGGALDDVECRTMRPSGDGAFRVTAISSDGHEFQLRCYPATLRDWPSAVAWLAKRPRFFPEILNPPPE